MCLLSILAPAPLHAQMQESKLYQRIMNPDMSLTFSGADKKFAGTGFSADKTASTHPFSFMHSAFIKPFQAKDFLGSKAFKSKDFGSRDRSANTSSAYAPGGKTFATRDVPVSTNSAAGKSYLVHSANQERPFLVRGKKQDKLDADHDAKPMTIDEVRDLLNKNK